LAPIARWRVSSIVVEHLYDWVMFEDLSGAGLAAALAGVDVASLDADAALGYALAAARLRRTYPVLEPAPVGEEVHHLDADRLVVHEVRAAYGCSQVAALAKITFAEFLRDIPAVAAGLATGVTRMEHARLLARETAPLAGKPGVREASSGPGRCPGHGAGQACVDRLGVPRAAAGGGGSTSAADLAGGVSGARAAAAQHRCRPGRERSIGQCGSWVG
jgi:hypothetical protein